jgi:hypothetical protein
MKQNEDTIPHLLHHRRIPTRNTTRRNTTLNKQKIKDWLTILLLMLIYVGGFFLILTVIKYITRNMI